MAKSKTKYIGWDHVPAGVLVKTRDKRTGLREFYLKEGGAYDDFLFLESDEEGDMVFTVCPGGRNGQCFNPDDFTTGKYKAVDL